MAKEIKEAYKPNMLVVFFVRLLFTLFARYYNIRPVIPHEVKKLKPPFLVLGNHVGFFDPFLTGIFLPGITHFVASDAAFSNPVFNFFLKRLGTIPTKKNVRDSQAIRDIIAVINRGGNVGIFPEAVRNWSGTSFPIDPSIAKLIKLLKVPVVVPVLKGMNLFNPRWSVKTRRTRVEIDYNLVMTSDEVKNLSKDEIFSRLAPALHHDEIDYQRVRMNKVRSKHKAEHISHVLYVCPECNEIDSFTSSGNEFHCRSCGYDIRIDQYTFFSRPRGGKLHFDNIRDWYNWEEAWLYKWVNRKLKQDDTQELFTDYGSFMYHLPERNIMKPEGETDISLFGNKIIIKFKNDREDIIWNFKDLQTINPQVFERLEVIYNNEAYRFIGGRKGVSGLKWEVAVNAIWRKLGYLNKLSPYIIQKERMPRRASF